MILDDVHRVCHGQAIDSFGNRYLLGVFENKADAEKAFDSWNKEYEQVGIVGPQPKLRLGQCLHSMLSLINLNLSWLVVELKSQHPQPLYESSFKHRCFISKVPRKTRLSKGENLGYSGMIA